MPELHSNSMKYGLEHALFLVRYLSSKRYIIFYDIWALFLYFKCMILYTEIQMSGIH